MYAQLQSNKRGQNLLNSIQKNRMLSIFRKLFGSSTDMERLISGGAILIDVRTKNEFDAGHINGARHIPLDSLQNRVEELKKINKPVITLCRSGARSSAAKTILSSAGLEAYNGGAWMAFKNRYALV